MDKPKSTINKVAVRQIKPRVCAVCQAPATHWVGYRGKEETLKIGMWNDLGDSCDRHIAMVLALKLAEQQLPQALGE